MSIRYLDSGRDGPGACLGQWLDTELRDGLRAFRAQFGFFDIGALRKYLPVLHSMITHGGQFRLVIGANASDPPSTDDVDALLPLISAQRSASLTIVALSNALFHPKAIHLVRQDGSPTALVGSANLTVKGLGHNVEAGLVIDCDDQTNEVINDIACAIDYWSTSKDPGVYQVASEDDAARLLDLGLVVPPAIRRRLRSANRARGSITGRGTRSTGWRPPMDQAVASELAEVEGAGELQGPVAEGAPEKVAIAAQWCKRLRSSDAQQVQAGTNPTGKLRLAKSRFDIDQTAYFRDEFFGDQDWVQVDRQGTIYEEVHIPFYVSRHGSEPQPTTVRVDHAPHRVADQRNVPTVLGWGPELGRWLRDNDQIGNWVLLEKDLNGRYWLSIQSDRPDWAP